MSHDPPRRERRSNHLSEQTSPYLLQHRYNPVDWYPWGPEALEKARREDKPIFLSIGYAACHWCHVMERESFEDERIAAFLGEHFVSIKVDREERPDIDDIYMTAVQLMTGQGGWPLNVFLTPGLEPFYGGTYFPPEGRYGRPGFGTLLEKIREAWDGRRGDVATTAEHLAGHVRALSVPTAAAAGGAPVGRAEIDRAAADLASRFDARWGGFGRAPKFPPHGAVRLLLREHGRAGNPAALDMAATTLDRMALGGMYDQIGGGFARYSVDDRWLVPHFEKMLYDQALLVPAYVEAWLLTRAPLHRRVIEETLDFVRREMTDPDGGFWSSLDADSEGHEGRFYVFDPDEVRAVLGAADGDFFCDVYGIEPGGNFEGKSIPNLLGGSLRERAAGGPADEDALAARLAPLRSRLRDARERRERPATDDKILTAWNGLMITAYAKAHQALGRDEDLASARRSAEFALGKLVRDGRLLASHRAGRSQINAYLDDHAFLARGLLDLYESCFDRRYLDAATAVARTLVQRFGDGAGGFFFTSDDHEELLTRTRSVHDGALPAGSGVAAEVLLRLAVHRDDPELRRAGIAALAAYAPEVARAPSAFAALLRAADFAESAPVEVALVGPPRDPAMRALLAAVRERHLPNLVVALSPGGIEVQDLPLLAGKIALDGKPTAYVCRGYACEAPTTDPETLAAALAI